MTLKIKFLKTNKLIKKDLIEVINLKNQEWKYTYRKHFLWIKKNIQKKDIHVILKFQNKTIGYTLLRDRTFQIEGKNKVRKFYLFDTHIIDKKYRKNLIHKKKPSEFLLKKITSFFKRKRSTSFLLCKKKLVKYYEKYNWKSLNNKNIDIKNLKNLKVMFFGKLDQKKNYKIYI